MWNDVRGIVSHFGTGCKGEGKRQVRQAEQKGSRGEAPCAGGGAALAPPRRRPCARRHKDGSAFRESAGFEKQLAQPEGMLSPLFGQVGMGRGNSPTVCGAGSPGGVPPSLKGGLGRGAPTGFATLSHLPRGGRLPSLSAARELIQHRLMLCLRQLPTGEAHLHDARRESLLVCSYGGAQRGCPLFPLTPPPARA